MTYYPIPPEKMAEYRAGARQREAARQLRLDARFQQAWEVARQGAEILRTQFGAQKVILFGSINLIRVEEAPERLRRRIERDGVML